MLLLFLIADVFMPEESTLEEDPVAQAYYAYLPRQAIPAAFTLINNRCINDSIVDQGSCGSCWAAGTASGQTMRRCLKGDPKLLSIEEHVCCDHTYTSGVTNNGCWGGNPIPAQIYSERVGDVYETCYPYDSYKTYYPYPPTTCRQNCVDGSAKKRLMSKNAHRVYGEDLIKQEIMNNGPVVASIDLYNDFPPKDKLVPYQVTSSSVKRGGHAAIIVGWGTYNGVKYWDIVNTYGKKWNTDGKVRIRRGSNDMRIESYVTAADVIVEGFDGSYPYPPEPEVPEAGTITFYDNWVHGQYALLKYSKLDTCSLKVDGTLVANITGTANISIYVSFAEGSHTLTCGTFSKKFSVVNYIPMFTTTSYTVEEKQNIAFRTTTKTGITQNIYYNNQNFSVTSTTTNVRAVLNRNVAHLYTTNTNPIVHAEAQVSVLKEEVNDGTMLTFINGPLEQYQKGETIRISLRQQYIFIVTAYLTTVDGTVKQTIKWQNPDNIKYLSTFYLNFTNAPEGTFYIFVKADTGRSVQSGTFSVGTQQKVCKILKPDNNSRVFEKMEFLLVTQNCVGQTLYVGGQKAATITSDEHMVQHNASSGNLALKVGDSSIAVTVLKQMAFGQATYTGSVNESIRVDVSNLPPEYTINANISYTLQSGYFVVKSSEPGYFSIEITSKNVVPNMMISAEILVVGDCQLLFDTTQTYFTGDSYQLTSSFCTGNYQIHHPNGSVTTSTSTFTPMAVGEYKICIENYCTALFTVHGVKLDLVTMHIYELTTPVSIYYAAGKQTKNLAFYIVCSGNTQTVTMLIATNNREATEQLVTFRIPYFGCKSAKFRALDVDNYNVFGATDRYIQIEEYPQEFE